MKDLWSSILVLTIFSVFVQAAEGSTYGIVPYVHPRAPGAVAGIVGAGGPLGAVMFGLGFLFIDQTKYAYFVMGSGVIIAGLLSLAMNIRGHGGIFLKSMAVASTAIALPNFEIRPSIATLPSTLDTEANLDVVEEEEEEGIED
jgi:NNP family nitrate/nitrite transporter-like MFS transporter